MASPSDRWQRLQALFYEAVELKPEARSEFLKKNCAGDDELRKELEGLLDATDKPLDLLRQPVLDAARRIVSAQDRSAIAPGTHLAHYEIISILGAGGMGEVYLANDSRLKRKVALKMLKPELTQDERTLRRFEHEAQAASALNHPNILTIYEFGQAEGWRFIASEFIEGQTLRQMMVANGRLHPDVTVEIGIQISSALSAAHACGIVHRDIKPDNVIVRTDGIAKVLDFGIAKLNERREQTIRRRALELAAATSEPGMVMGTAKYMSPEQARGLVVDERSDIFSLGSVMYEMTTGRTAFDGETASDVMAAILTTDPAPPANSVPDLPYELERIISKALRKARETRYQSAKDMMGDLKEFKNESEFRARLQGSASPHPGRSGGWGSSTSVRAAPLQSESAHSSVVQRWFGPVVAAVLALAAIGYLSVKKPYAPLASVQPRTLAILPFRNLKPDPDTDFLGFSLADEIITRVSNVNALTVRPSSSIDKYRNQAIDPKKVAEELNVDTLLTGSFLKDADQLRITTQLIDVKSDKILWRDAIDVKYDKLLTVQDQVSEQIIKGLELNLSPAEARSIKSEKPVSGAAYEYYLRGIDLYSLNQFAAAIDQLEKSTAMDPNYAPSWAYLGRAHTTYASLAFGGRESYIKAQAAYDKSIALDPTLAEPRVYMANLLTDTGRVEQAVPLLRAVLKNSPNNAEAHWELGYAYRFAGMLQESAAECETARQNDPRVKINSAALNTYLYQGQYEKFLRSLPVNDNVLILFYRGLGEYYANNHDQAAKYFDQAYQRDSFSLPAEVGKALSYSIRHDNARGLKLLEETESKIEERGVSDAEGIYKLAQAFAVLGDKPSGLHMLRHSIGGGFFCYPYFERDPLLENLRSEVEFKSLMQQALDRHEQFKKTFF